MKRTLYVASITLIAIATVLVIGQFTSAADRPNILWLTSEDNGQELGCYGCEYAVTPNLDALASRGVIYNNAWSTAPVCAPARTTIISGVYPPSLGGQHMRSEVVMPAFMKMYPQYLREAGYFCTNKTKEDYNLTKPGQVWDEAKTKSWKDRAEGQPFFAIFNFTISHESQIRNNIPEEAKIHDPDKAPVPAYHPNIPEVRRDWAQYHDRITMMDKLCGQTLDELEADGLADDTIVFYYGDHGSGMPRSKRWPYNSGLEVPMIVYVPEKFQDLAPEGYAPGGELDRMVGFIDLAPTLLSIIGIEPPAYMQGNAFLGKYETPAPKYMYGFRGRMDERYDCVRTVRTEQYQYIRNFNPHKIYGQYIQYMFVTPTTRVWKQLYDEGKLDPPQTYFWETKPAEELYDLKADPDEVNNLADDPKYAVIKAELQTALRDKMIEVCDLGLLAEMEFHARADADGMTPYDMGHDKTKYDVEAIYDAAVVATSLKPEAVQQLKAYLKSDDSGIRYWGAMGFLMRGKDAVQAGQAELVKALRDPNPAVQIAAAESLGRYGSDADAAQSLDVLMKFAKEGNAYQGIAALNAVDYMDDRAASVLDEVKQLKLDFSNDVGRVRKYCNSLQTKIIADLEGK